MIAFPGWFSKSPSCVSTDMKAHVTRMNSRLISPIPKLELIAFKLFRKRCNASDRQTSYRIGPMLNDTHWENTNYAANE